MKPIHQLFEEQVEKKPHRTALRYSAQELNYEDLNAYANQLGCYLRRLGVGTGELVGICLERSLDAVVGMMAILKAGGAFVPLDPAGPAQRTLDIIKHAQLKVVVMIAEFRDRICADDLHTVCLDADSSKIVAESSANMQSVASGDSAAYVIYTSGSSGIPKGIVLSHQSTINGLDAIPWGVDREDEICSWNTSLSFGFSVSRLFLPLLCGVPLVVIPEEVAKDPEQLTKAWERERVTAASLVTPFLREILRGGPRLTARLQGIRTLIIAGAVMHPDMANAFATAMPNATLVNSYGASEIGGAAIQWRITSHFGSAQTSIAHFFPNTRTYILNEDMSPIHEGETGELYVSAAHLSRGYLHQPALTAERFPINPFDDGLGERLYKTGDLGRCLPDGQLELLGRVDDRVKIRGCRVELGEIEAAIQGYTYVQTAAVVANDVNGDKQLNAYVVLRVGSNGIVSDLRRYLSERLPSYMIPSTFMVLEDLPHTHTGKLDRKALPLPEPNRPEMDMEYSTPRNPYEAIIADIWARLLGLKQVGIHDDFIALGGHSLLAVQVSSRIRDRFGVEISPNLILERSTIAELAAEIFR